MQPPGPVQPAVPHQADRRAGRPPADGRALPASREDVADEPVASPDLDGPTVEVPVVAGSALPPRPRGRGQRSRVVRAGARGVAGAGVAVAGVCLGIATLLWATDAPVGTATSTSTVGSGLAAAGDAADEPAVALPGDDGAPAGQETAPVDPPPLPAPEPEPVVAAPAEPVGEAPPAAPVPPAAPEAPAPAAAPAAAPAPAPVLVLNNSRVDGLAERAAATFERAGWPVQDTGGLRGRIRATTVYYPPGQEAVAREFAARFDGVERVLPRLAGLPGSGLTVVVTRDFRP